MWSMCMSEVAELEASDVLARGIGSVPTFRMLRLGVNFEVYRYW